MTIYNDLFGQKEMKNKQSDVFVYDIKANIRAKILLILFDDENWRNCPSGQKTADLERVRYVLLKQLGITRLNVQTKLYECFKQWIFNCDIVHLFWTIEIFCEVKARTESKHLKEFHLPSIISQINQVFAMNMIGYEILNNRIVKKDTEYLHSEVIKKALNLIHDEDFISASNEFRDALTKYAKGDAEGALVSANASLESTMKIILEKDKGKAGKLISELLRFEINGTAFITKYFEDFLECMKKILQIVPIIRDEEGAHGKGRKKKKPSKEFVQFALHQTGAVLVFLVNRFNQLKKR